MPHVRASSCLNKDHLMRTLMERYKYEGLFCLCFMLTRKKNVSVVTVELSSLAAKQVAAFIGRTDNFLEATTYKLTVWLPR